jgi:hypothetical protein
MNETELSIFIDLIETKSAATYGDPDLDQLTTEDVEDECWDALDTL